MGEMIFFSFSAFIAFVRIFYVSVSALSGVRVFQITELKWFESYLTKRQQVCFINGHISSPRQITCGVPQGSILGPLLFLLYINDMPQCLKSTTPCLYADDTDIFAASHDYGILVKSLNDYLKNLHTWLAKNKLQYHPTKTKLMFIGSPHNLKNRIGESSVFFGDKQVPVTHSFESLGVELMKI